MTKAEVLKYLKDHRDERGIAHWEKHSASSGGLESCGIGLTRLRKYAKELGRNASLAEQLWKTQLYEAKVLSLLIDDPKSMTVEQAETQVEELHGGYLAHVFSSCDATLAKTKFVVELAEAWVVSEDPVRRRCGYGLVYEVSKSKKKSAPEEPWFRAIIQRIETTREGQNVDTLMAMGTALMGIGMRSKALHAAALKIAKKLGPIEFDPDGRCEPFDVTKRLNHQLVKKRLGLKP